MRTEGDIAAIRYNLGNRVMVLRTEQDLSQYKFSDMIKMDRSYLIDVEKGRRNVSIDNLIKIAQGFDIPLSQLFEGVDDEESVRQRLQLMRELEEQEQKQEAAQADGDGEGPQDSEPASSDDDPASCDGDGEQ